MLKITASTVFVSSVIIGIIILCTIGIVIATIFQSKKSKKYNECLEIIKEKGNIKFEVRDGLTKEEIKNIDSKIDMNQLMQRLYNKFLKFVDKVKNNDTKLDALLSGAIKSYYIKKLENNDANGYSEVLDKIELIGYTITDYKENKLNFRVSINCYDYKLFNGNIISGSNLSKLEEVYLLTFEKISTRWYITNYDKVYEKKLSD